MPRWSLAALTGGYALCLGWSALVLPWRTGTTFFVATGALALLNAAVATLAAARHRALRPVWRALAWSALVYYLWLCWQIVSSALYLSEIYESLGQGIALLLILALLLFGALTLPVALWWFVRERRDKRQSQALGAAAAVWLAATAGVAVFDSFAPSTHAVPEGTPQTLAALLRVALPRPGELPEARGQVSLFSAPAARCTWPAEGATLAVVSYVARTRPPRAESDCVQGPPAKLFARVGALVRRRAVRGPIKVDLLRVRQPLRLQPGPIGPLVDSLAVRPGLDGVCLGNRCLMPWQLVAHDVFASATPLPYADEIHMGVSFEDVRRLLGAEPAAGSDAEAGAFGLARLETQSLGVDAEGRARAFQRGAQIAREPNLDNLRRAEQAARTYIRRAQQRDGQLRYQYDMYSGASVLDNPSIPRHAGTALAMCETGGGEVRGFVRRALGALASWERRSGRLSALVRDPNDSEGDLGSSALGLVALLSCRKHVGDRYDALIGRLGRLLLTLEDERGHFHPAYDLARARVIEGPTPLFAGGQAVFGLSLLEALAKQHRGSSALPDASRLTAAVELAMNYVAHDYWPSPLGDFFYLKENWHCLAARASLHTHPNDAYEQFCLDYAEFKSRRFLVDETSRVDPDFYGGYNFGNLVPPHNGSTAGVGEALASAIEIQRARHRDASALTRRLKQVLGFLLSRQYLDDNCFGCSNPKLAFGGFTGESVGAMGRIDHNQHALSAIGLGRRQLERD